MANDDGRFAVRTSLPLAVFWLAACTVPDTEGADTAAARQGNVPPALALAVAKVGWNVASRALGAAETVGTMQIRESR